ncbi:M14 family zinc carboxypeptidase [Alkalihalobacterium bogoriense]|uniref:M14 family zinc carboxypeptidase n=1 Tax=Alkalihalobacterium bogoriense TaxID=246272 RepID=UPI00068616AC|nr:M14 family zinc carboxypeptidase [Alkalihalobacterium bogoriense]
MKRIVALFLSIALVYPHSIHAQNLEQQSEAVEVLPEETAEDIIEEVEPVTEEIPTEEPVPVAPSQAEVPPVEVEEVLSIEEWLAFAAAQTTATKRLLEFSKGYLHYEDVRFVTGINENARTLLNSARSQHNKGNFDVAIGRYQTILDSPALDENISKEATIRIKYANLQIIPTAKNVNDYAAKQNTSLKRLTHFQEGLFLYPKDKRFETGINKSAKTLLSTARKQHIDGKFTTAVNRFETILLSETVLHPHVLFEAQYRLQFAKDQKQIPTANKLVEDAKKQSSSSKRLEHYSNGHILYPNDKRFRSGINESARTLLSWASKQHQQGKYNTAKNRYNLILDSPVLSAKIKRETEARLVYAKAKKKVPTANSLNNAANKLSSNSAKLDKFVEAHILYPKDKRFKDGIEKSARGLLNWSIARHKAGEFDRAIKQYDKIINTLFVPKSIKDQARTNKALAEKGTRIADVKKIVNAKVQNYTYTQMEKDMKQLESMYPEIIQTKIIGTSVDGRNIYAIKLGRGKTEVLINGSNHAREHMTTNVIMKQIDEYAFAYTKGNQFGGFNVKQVLDRTSIWYVPMVNPDGVTLVQQGPNALRSNKLAQQAIQINSGSRNFAPWKANVRGVDLNRQFPHFWTTITNNPGKPSPSMYKGTKPLTEPEAITMRDFVESNKHLKTVIDYHSSGEVIFVRNPTQLTTTLSRKTGYSIIDVTKSTSGGGFASWFNVYHKKPGITLEISPYVGDRPVPVGNWDRVWRQNDSVGLIVANEAYQNRNKR